MPMNGANLGDSSESAMIAASRLLWCSETGGLGRNSSPLGDVPRWGGLWGRVEGGCSSLLACSNGGSVRWCW